MKKIFALLLVLMLLVPCIIACSCGGDETPDSTPESTPVSTPSSKPTPDSTPESTPNSTPDSTPSSRPSLEPDSTVDSTPDSTVDSTPSSTPESKPDSTPESTPSSTPESTPSSTPESTPSSTPESTPSSTPESTPSSTPESTPSSTPSSTPESLPEPTDSWDGETLDILATIWGESLGAPWSQIELTVGPDDWDSSAGFGQKLNFAVLTRADYIKTNYGVTLNWINARSAQISTLLTGSMATGGAASSQKYHIAMPRMMEAQTIVENQAIYDLAGSEYIDFSKSYYNAVAKESYTVQGHTFFAAGDFSFLDEQTSFLTFYNLALANTINNFPDLYEKVRQGTWTIDEMTQAARLVTKDIGTSGWTDDDIYGFGTTALRKFYQYSGIQQVKVNKQTQKYEVSLKDPKVGTLIDKLLEIKGAEWARTEWTGGYEAMGNAFSAGRLLFYDEVVQKTDYFTNQSDEFKVGLLPAPKLSADQATYYTPCSYQAVVMCIPRSTLDRDMSEFFFEVLSATGQKFIMSEYKKELKSKLDVDTADESMEILENYIFANLCYDQGYMYDWNGLLTSVQDGSFSEGKNNFTTVYNDAEFQAKMTVANWNNNWGDYEDE